MDIIARPSGGQNIVGRPQARARWYPAPTRDAHDVEVFMQELDPLTGEQLGAPISLGRFHPEALLTIPYNPTSDKNVRLYAMSYAPDGTPSHSSLSDATRVDVTFSRESAAPTLALIGSTTNTSAQIQVSGFTQFATKRRVRKSPNADMSGATTTVNDYTGMTMPDVIVATRAGAPGVATIYIAVSHSSGGGFGAESSPLAVTFADSGGAGGSTGGDGSPYPQDPY